MGSDYSFVLAILETRPFQIRNFLGISNMKIVSHSHPFCKFSRSNWFKACACIPNAVTSWGQIIEVYAYAPSLRLARVKLKNSQKEIVLENF